PLDGGSRGGELAARTGAAHAGGEFARRLRRGRRARREHEARGVGGRRGGGGGGARPSRVAGGVTADWPSRAGTTGSLLRILGARSICHRLHGGPFLDPLPASMTIY